MYIYIYILIHMLIIIILIMLISDIALCVYTCVVHVGDEHAC